MRRLRWYQELGARSTLNHPCGCESLDRADQGRRRASQHDLGSWRSFDLFTRLSSDGTERRTGDKTLGIGFTDAIYPTLLLSIPLAWSTPLDQPVPLSGGQRLVTLKDAADFISNLPKNEQHKPEWQIALHCLIEAAEGREFLMYARIRVLRALDLNAGSQSTHREGALPVQG